MARGGREKGSLGYWVERTSIEGGTLSSMAMGSESVTRCKYLYLFAEPTQLSYIRAWRLCRITKKVLNTEAYISSYLLLYQINIALRLDTLLTALTTRLPSYTFLCALVYCPMTVSDIMR